MNCNDVRNNLLDFMDGSLDPGSSEKIQKHLEGCETCRQELSEMREISQIIAKAPSTMPTAALRENFNNMLRDEENKLAAGQPAQSISFGRNLQFPAFRIIWRVAAGLALLVAGILIGTIGKKGSATDTYAQISDLKKEVKDMKEALMFTLLKEESASQRIKAVNYAGGMADPNQQVMSALINTLNHDKNVNVRLASLYSLEKFSDNQMVRDSLLASLRIQTEPIIQVVLINMLAEKKDSRAIDPIREIIADKKTLQVVRDLARKGLKTL